MVGDSNNQCVSLFVFAKKKQNRIPKSGLINKKKRTFGGRLSTNTMMEQMTTETANVLTLAKYPR